MLEMFQIDCCNNQKAGGKVLLSHLLSKTSAKVVQCLFNKKFSNNMDKNWDIQFSTFLMAQVGSFKIEL